MNTIKNIAACFGIFLACLMQMNQAAYAEVAGYAQFVNGNVKTVSVSGVTSTLEKGAAVNEGDTLLSAKGASAQIKMQDGGLVAVRPETTLRFDSFKYKGKEDGSENLLFTLIKGGFRSVTGMIGRSNKPKYRIATGAAIIGIRGTDHETFVVTPDGPLANAAPAGTYNKVNIGETYISTDKGTIFVLANQMGFAGAMDQVPQLQPINTNIFTVAPKPTSQGMGDKKGGVRDTAAVDPNEQVQAVATNTTPTGPDLLQIPVCTTDLANGQCVDLAASPVPTSGGNGVKFIATTGLSGIDSVTAPHAAGTPPLLTEIAPLPSGATYTFDATGIMRFDCGMGCFGANYTAQILDAGWDSGVVQWGRWSNGSIAAGGWGNGLYFGPDQGLHYIVGIPTPLAQLPLNTTATYNLIGGTSPTPSDGVGGGLGVGHLVSGSATVNFTNATVNGNLVMGFNGASIYQANYSGFMEGGLYLNGTTIFKSGAIDVCGVYGCSTQYQGQFYGANAMDLGVGYMIQTGQNFNINGVAAYRR